MIAFFCSCGACLSRKVRGCGIMSEIVWAYTGTKNWQTTAIISLLVRRNMFGGPPHPVIVTIGDIGNCIGVPCIRIMPQLSGAGSSYM